jgi:hypothetical protein
MVALGGTLNCSVTLLPQNLTCPYSLNPLKFDASHILHPTKVVVVVVGACVVVEVDVVEVVVVDVDVVGTQDWNVLVTTVTSGLLASIFLFCTQK